MMSAWEIREKRSVVTSPSGSEVLICERLKKFGYSQERRIRLYGEEFHLISNPFPDGGGFAVEGIARTSGQLKKMRIPLSLVQTLKRELDLREHADMAA
jgi:hypothetical protein